MTYMSDSGPGMTDFEVKTIDTFMYMKYIKH